MYTSTPLSLLPFSLQHFLLLPAFLQASPPVFAPLFPLIILQMFHPLPFYHPHLSLSPPMLPSLLSPSSGLFSPLLHPPPCFSFFLSSQSPPLWSPYHSPLLYFLLLPFFPGNSSALSTYCPFTLFCPLFYSLPTSIIISPVLSLLLSPPIHCLFPPLPSLKLLAPTSLLRHKPNT